MTSPNNALPTMALALALVAGACSSTQVETALPSETTTTTTATATTPDPAPDPAVAEDSDDQDDSAITGSFDGEGAENLDVGKLVQNLGVRYKASEGVWPGFVPNEHPVVVALKDGDSQTFKAIAINVADPGLLGAAVALDSSGTPFDSLHEVTNLNADTKTKLDNMQNFEFHVMLAGVDSFAITAGPALGADDPDYAATLIHELFHRWQDEGFQPNANQQDVAGYNYSKDNLELALLESRALAVAIDADSEVDRMTAARHYAALRLARTKADSRIILDNGQEQIEGSARYFEHVSHTAGGAYGPDDFSSELGPEFLSSGVKEWFGFGRFYASGAGAIHLAVQLGDTDALSKISAGGAFPGDLVIAATGVADSDVDDLIAQARTAYDNDGSMAKQAAEAEEKAKTESGDIFSDPGGDQGDGIDADSQGIDLTPEQIECLNDAEIPASGEISDEVFERCVGG